MPYSRTPLGEIVKKINDSTGVCEGLVDSNGASLDSLFLNATEVAAARGVVSPDGNLAYAAVASTTGTAGEVRKLSDGPDKGAVLVWAIPEGRSVYAWCWQIYPLAAYL